VKPAPFPALSVHEAPHVAPNAPKRVMGGGPEALEDVRTPTGSRHAVPAHRIPTRRVPTRPTAALALLVAVSFTSVTGAWSTAPAGAQEPSDGGQVVCPAAPIQASGTVFGPTVGEVATASIDFRCADLRGAVFDGLTLIQARFDGANLSGASFNGSRLGQAQFRRATLQQATFTDADLTQAKFDGADMRETRVVGGKMIQTELPGANMVGAVLDDVDLGQANLTGARMAGVDATDSRFSQTELVGADLTDATLRDAVLNQAVLTDAKLTGADLTDANGLQARMQGADLTGADLTSASFAQADLSNANLTGATVTDTDFIQADLQGAVTEDLVGASETFPKVAWFAMAGGAVIVVTSGIGLVLRIIRRRIGPVNPYDTPLTVGNTTVSFVLVPVFAIVQAVGLYLLVCGVAGLIGSSLNPLGTQTGAPIIGDLAFQPQTIVYGAVLLIGGGIARGFGRRF